MKRIVLSFILVIAASFSIPTMAWAQDSSPTCDELKNQFTNFNAADLAEQFPKICSEGKIYNKIVAVLYYFIGIAGVIAAIYGGYVYMFARGNAAEAAKGRQILTWAIVGVIVATVAAAIVNLVVRALQDNNLF